MSIIYRPCFSLLEILQPLRRIMPCYGYTIFLDDSNGFLASLRGFKDETASFSSSFLNLTLDESCGAY